MLVSPEADRALAAITAVVGGAASDPTLPAARAGLDIGEVVPLAGD
jgi:hypothetical protein